MPKSNSANGFAAEPLRTVANDADCSGGGNAARPHQPFAGIWMAWKGARGPKSSPVEGEHQLFGFQTTNANAEVGAIHPKAMPMILRTEQEIETWMTAPAEEALTLQRPVRDGSLRVIGAKEDGPVEQLGSADRPQALPK
jgi:putative SOS response-associated peptidase YedK